MKNLKRVLSLALSTAMVLGMMVVGSSAADADKVYANNKAIATVKVLEIMEGDENGNFNADKVVTRNEMAVVMSNLMELKLNGVHPFTDVPSWADKYVAAVYTNGLSAGTSATTYGGSENVTTAQAALMLMKTLGYFEYQGEFKDDWKLETVKRAMDLDLFDDVDAGVDEGLTRGELAQLVYNTLNCGMVRVTEESGMSVEGNGITVNQKPSYYYNTLYRSNDVVRTLAWDVYDIASTYALETETWDAYGRPGVEIEYAKSDVDAIKVIETPDYVFTNTDGDLTDAQMLVDDEKMDDEDFLASVWADLANAVIGKGYVVELFENEVMVNGKEKDVVTDFIVYTYDAIQIDELVECDEDDDEDWIDEGAKYYVELKTSTMSATMEDKIYDIQIPGFDADEFVDDAWIMVPVRVYDTEYADNYADIAPVDPEGLEIDGEDESVYYGVTIPETVSGVIENVRDNGKKVTIDDTKYEALFAVDCEAEDEYKLVLDPAGYVIATEEIENNATLEDVYAWIDTYSTDVKWGNEVYAVLVDMKGEITELKIDADVDADDVVVDFEYEGLEEKAGWDEDNQVFENQPAEGALVVIDENDDDNNVLIAWDEEDFDVDDAANITIEKKQSKLGSKRLNSETQYILIEGKEDDIEATVKVGGVNMDASKCIWITEEDEKEVLYVIVIEDVELTETAAAEDLLYIYEVDKYEAKDYFKQEVIFADGTVETVKIDNSSKSLVDGNEDEDMTNGGAWYTFTINSDGYYELKNFTDFLTTADIADAGNEWDDEEGVITGATVEELYKGKLTAASIEDIDVSDEIVFIDMHDEEDEDNGAWDKKVNTLDKLWDLIDVDVEDTKVADIDLELYVDEDNGVTLIILNWIAEYVAP